MYLDEFLRNIEDELGEKIPCLEYGSGTAVPYFKGKDADFLDVEFEFIKGRAETPAIQNLIKE